MNQEKSIIKEELYGLPPEKRRRIVIGTITLIAIEITFRGRNATQLDGHKIASQSSFWLALSCRKQQRLQSLKLKVGELHQDQARACYELM